MSLIWFAIFAAILCIALDSVSWKNEHEKGPRAFARGPFFTQKGNYSYISLSLSRC